MKISRRAFLKSSAGTAAAAALVQAAPLHAVAATPPALAGITLGDTPSNVMTKLGAPKDVRPAHGAGVPEWVYTGIVVRFVYLGSTQQAVKSVHLTESAGGSADFGLKVGSTVTDLRRAYGGALQPYGTGGGYRRDLSSLTALDFVTAGDRIDKIILSDRSCVSCGPAPVSGPGQKKS